MKKALVAGALLCAVAAAPPPTAAQYVKPVPPSADVIERYNMASTEARRSIFAAAMSSLTPDQRNGLIANSYGAGPVEFFKVLKEWRDAGELRGLELR